MNLKITNLSYRLKTNQKPLIEGISLELEPGILYGILGPNGSGKSTFLKTLARIWTSSTGEIRWQDQNLLEYSRLAMSRTVSLVPQNPSLHFDFTVQHMVEMGRYPLGLRAKQIEYEVQKALIQVNAWHLRDRFLSQLSGGEKQRIYIARALMTQAPILLLDEPTSHLDLRHQLEIWHLLQTLVKEGKIVIVALHDLLAAKRFCQEVMILHQGRCQEKGTYGEVMTPKVLNEVFGVMYDKEKKILELDKKFII